MTPKELQNKIKAFVGLRKNDDKLKARRKKLGIKIDELSMELSAHMKLNSIGNLETTDGGRIGTTTNYYPNIDDFDVFKHWAEHEGQKWVTLEFAGWKEKYGIGDTIKPIILNTTVNRSVALAMLKHFRDVAEQEGVELADLLPPGLSYTAKPSLTYRKPTAKQAAKQRLDTEVKSALEVIRELTREDGRNG